jgi:hypothetical protein
MSRIVQVAYRKFRVLCINITRLPLEMCRAASATEFLKVGLAQNILASITHLLLLAVVAFSLVRHFRKQNSCSAKMPTLISGILFSLTALLWLPVVVLSGYLKTQTINQLKMNVWFNSERREKLAILENTETKIEVGYQAMCVATYFAAAIFSLRALKLSTAPKVQLWTALTFVALIIMPLCIFIIRVGWTIPGERMHYTSSIVFIVFEDLSLTFALFGIVKSVYNSTVASSGTDINPTGNLNSTKQGVNWPSF